MIRMLLLSGVVRDVAELLFHLPNDLSLGRRVKDVTGSPQLRH